VTLDDELSAWVATDRRAATAKVVRERAKLLLLDAVASAYAGRGTPDVAAVARLAATQFGPGTSPVIGGERLSPAGAALLNGFQTTAATVCDVHRPTLTHVTPEVVPAALAAAHQTGAPGADLLTAVAIGCEVTVRVAAALNSPAYRARGFHNPGIAGAVGAACAVARLLGLNQQGVRDAIAHAASQAGGTFAALGSSGVKVHQARGALSGLLAAGFAAAGIDGAARPLSNERGGLLAAYADGGVPEALTAQLGDRWTMDEISLRRWPAASSLQPVIAAVLQALEAAPAGTGLQLHAAEVALPPRGYLLNGRAGWGSQLEALQSARWIAAVVAADGECWVPQTAPARLADIALGQFAAAAVTVVEDVSLQEGAARVRLVWPDGNTATREVGVSPGDPRAPLGWDDIVTKLNRALDATGSAGIGSGIAAAVAGIDDLPALALLNLITVPHREEP
jgi:2-methylcitrate dehydratase PrpD